MTEPFPYQLEGVEAIEKFGGRALLSDAMGLGKSLEALLWMHRHPEIERAIVVCPASLKIHWQREAKNHLGIRSEILEGREPSRPKGMKLTIINYDVLTYWLPKLIEYGPQLVILDECHMASNRTAKRSKAARALCRKAKHAIAISGTPLTNRPAELYNVLNILRPDLFGSWWSYAQQYIGPQIKPWGWDFSGAKNLPALHHKLKSNLMIRRLKSDVMKQLPPVSRVVVPLEISDRKQYEEAETDFIRWLQKTEPDKVSAALRAEGLVKLGYLIRLAASLKMSNAIDWLKASLESGEKLLVFAIHQQVIGQIRDAFESCCAVVDGSVEGNKRQGIFDAFNRDHRTKMLVGNLKAAGVGWSCQSTSNVVFAETGWTPGGIEQGMSRCHGQGRGKEGDPVTAYFLTAQHTVEGHLCRLVQKKAEILDAVLDAKKVTKLDIYDEMTKSLREKKKHEKEEE